MKKYKGVVIEESLLDNKVLESVEVISTKIEKVTGKHKTPWVNQWTMYNIEIDTEKAEEVAGEIARDLDNKNGNWYADFKNDEYHFIIYKNKFFKVDRNKKSSYEKSFEYGLSIGIPEYQLMKG